MRRHLPLASASAVVFIVLGSPLMPGQTSFGQVKSSIRARVQIMNTQASWSADGDARKILERAVQAVKVAGSVDVITELKPAASSTSDGIGVFFDLEYEPTAVLGSTGSADYRPSSRNTPPAATREYPTSAIRRDTVPATRLVVYVHHLAN